MSNRVIRILAGFLVLAVLGGCASGSSEDDRRIAQLEEEVKRLTEELERSTSTVAAVTTSAPTTTDTPTTTTEPPTTTTQSQPVLLQGALVLTGLSSQFIGQSVDMIVSEDSTTCVGHRGFDDIGASTQITITDENGTLIGATTFFGESHYIEIEPMEFEIGIGQCVFGFSVEVPGDRSFYSVEAAHRGGVTYSKTDLEASGWYVEIALGR